MPTTTYSRRIRVLAIVVVAVLIGVGAGSAAQATIIDRATHTETYDYENWNCGYPMRVQGSSTHHVQVRADRRFDGVVYFTDQYSFSETQTNAAGVTISVSGNALSKDVKARLVEGSLYEFTSANPGQTITIRDPAGRVISRDRGSLRFNYTFDLVTGEFTFLGVQESGPHPVFDVDFCRLVAPYVGTDSARHLHARPLGTTDASMGYYEYLPPSYSSSGAKSPLLIATNGYGENGDGSAGQLGNLLFTGIPRFIDLGGWPTARPLVVLATQHVEVPPGFDFSPCDGVEWGGSCAMQLQHDRGHAPPAFCTTPGEIHDFIAYAVAHYNVDAKRVYLTGLSCGGFGAWEYLAQYRDEQVAAALPIAAEGRPALATAGCGVGDVAIWAIHGELDDVVNPDGSVVPMTQLRACPGAMTDRTKLTIYPGLTHDGWDQAYSGSLGDDIYTWMLGFSLP